MDIIFSDQPVKYEIKGRHVIVTGKDVLVPSENMAKDIRISGVVKDELGEPVSGANVVVKGQVLGTITDMDGRYSLNVPAKSVLVVTFIGYKTKEVPVGKQSVINVTLSEDAELLDEVVVTALGIKREEKALGYSVQKVGGERLAAVKQ